MVVLLVSPRRFATKPQIGERVWMSWEALAVRLMRPTPGDAKDLAGAWSPARYKDNVRRKSNIESVYAVVVDVDEGGDPDHVARALARYMAIVHSTFSSTPHAPRCRIVLPLRQPVDATTYERTHAVVRSHLGAAAIVADDGAKDPSRLSFWPVVRPGAEYHVRVCTGELLDAAAVLAAQPPLAPRREPKADDPGHKDAYIRGALRRAADAVARASAGDRHSTICREAWGLARLGLSERRIATALVPAWIYAAGEARRHEGERTIRDAVRARKGAA